MRTLENHLGSADSSNLQPGLIELLQARSDVRNGQARQAMERLRSIDIQHVPAHLYWMVSGEAQVQLQQLDAAIQSYGLAIGASPNSVAAFVQRAEALQQLQTLKSAEADYSAAIRLSPSSPTLYMRRALVRETLGDLDGAINDMDSALDLEPESNRMLFTRARFHQLANHREEYLRDYKSGITATPKVVDDWVARALAQLPRFPQKAKADLQEALRMDSDSVIALQNLAHLESEHLHDMKAAMTALNQILELSPENETARAGRCVVLARQGLIEECLQDVDFLSKLETKLLPSTLYQMGCAHALIFKQNEDSAENAVRLLARAIRLGYGAEIIATDSDLDLIRDQASFVALSAVSEYYKAN
jgi:tetratricopeptide (TPR) repeat protein